MRRPTALLNGQRCTATRAHVRHGGMTMRVVCVLLTAVGLTAGSAVAQTALETPPVGTMAQVMRGIYFPNANLIFDVQMQDPAEPRGGGRR